MHVGDCWMPNDQRETECDRCQAIAERRPVSCARGLSRRAWPSHPEGLQQSPISAALDSRQILRFLDLVCCRARYSTVQVRPPLCSDRSQETGYCEHHRLPVYRIRLCNTGQACRRFSASSRSRDNRHRTFEAVEEEIVVVGVIVSAHVLPSPILEASFPQWARASSTAQRFRWLCAPAYAFPPSPSCGVQWPLTAV